MATKVLRSGSRHEVEPGRPERFQEIESDLTDIANQVRTILPTIKTKDGSNLADTIEKIERVKKRLNEIEGAMLQRENDYLRLEVELEQCKYFFDNIHLVGNPYTIHAVGIREGLSTIVKGAFFELLGDI